MKNKNMNLYLFLIVGMLHGSLQAESLVVDDFVENAHEKNDAYHETNFPEESTETYLYNKTETIQPMGDVAIKKSTDTKTVRHQFNSGITRTQIITEPLPHHKVRITTKSWTTKNPSYFTVSNLAFAAGATVAGIGALVFINQDSLTKYFASQDINIKEVVNDSKSEAIDKQDVKNDLYLNNDLFFDDVISPEEAAMQPEEPTVQPVKVVEDVIPSQDQIAEPAKVVDVVDVKQDVVRHEQVVQKQVAVDVVVKNPVVSSTVPFVDAVEKTTHLTGQAAMDQLAKTGVCHYCDFNGKDLRSIIKNHKSIDLKGSTLMDVNIAGTKLHSFNVEKCRIKGLNAAGAVIRNLNAQQADWRENSWHRSDMRGTEIAMLNLRKANINKANFSGVSVDVADISWTSGWFHIKTLMPGKVDRFAGIYSSLWYWSPFNKQYNEDTKNFTLKDDYGWSL